MASNVINKLFEKILGLLMDIVRSALAKDCKWDSTNPSENGKTETRRAGPSKAKYLTGKSKSRNRITHPYAVHSERILPFFKLQAFLFLFFSLFSHSLFFLLIISEQKQNSGHRVGERKPSQGDRHGGCYAKKRSIGMYEFRNCTD